MNFVGKYQNKSDMFLYLSVHVTKPLEHPCLLNPVCCVTNTGEATLKLEITMRCAKFLFKYEKSSFIYTFHRSNFLQLRTGSVEFAWLVFSAEKEWELAWAELQHLGDTVPLVVAVSPWNWAFPASFSAQNLPLTAFFLTLKTSNSRKEDHFEIKNKTTYHKKLVYFQSMPFM